MVHRTQRSMKEQQDKLRNSKCEYRFKSLPEPRYRPLRYQISYPLVTYWNKINFTLLGLKITIYILFTEKQT